MRVTAAVAFVLLLSLDAGAQPFQEAVPDGKQRGDADAFTFRDGWRRCRVAATGEARCRRQGGRDWTFRLPVRAERIETLSFSRYGSDLLIAYVLHDGEAARGQIVRIAPGARRPRWQFQVRGLNMAKPVLHHGSMVVAALAYRARVDVETGSAQWVIESAYDGDGYEIPEIALSGTHVIVRSRHGRTRRVRSDCFDADTGAPVSCGP